MTGPEHYQAAERLLSDASFITATGTPVNREGRPVDARHHAALIERAQVHATLALAAATRDASIPPGMVLVEQCRTAESAYGRQCIKATGHNGGCDFGDGEGRRG